MTLRGDNQEGRGPAPVDIPLGHIDEWEDQAVDYLDGRLSDSAKAAIECHLKGCPLCSARIQAQREAIAFLERSPLQDAPFDLEDRVIGEVLFPSQPYFSPQPEELRRSTIWRRKFRAWVPATVAVAAVLVAIVAYGVFKPSNEVSTTSREIATTVVAGQAAGTADSEVTLGAALTSVPEGANSLGDEATTTTAAGALTTATIADGATEITAAAGEQPVVIEDRESMVDTLRTSEGPAYIAFEAASFSESDGNGSTGPTADRGQVDPGKTDPGKTTQPDLPDWVEEVASQVTAFTGLEPLTSSPSSSSPSFAAFVSRKQVSPFVDLMFSIAASVGIDMVLQLEPNPEEDATASVIVGHRAELPVLVGELLPQPSVVRISFTTSTMAPSSGHSDEVRATLPDQAGTHILVVVFLRP